MPRKKHYAVVARCCGANEKISEAEPLRCECNSRLIAQRRMAKIFDAKVWKPLHGIGSIHEYVQTSDYIAFRNDLLKVRMEIVPIDSPAGAHNGCISD